VNPPPITDAKRVAFDNRALGAMILTFGDGSYATASYGLTRPLCDAMRSVNEQIADLIKSGTIKIPDALKGRR
jgi:hypothetical protein